MQKNTTTKTTFGYMETIGEDGKIAVAHVYVEGIKSRRGRI